jgi:hypothetical protein
MYFSIFIESRDEEMKSKLKLRMRDYIDRAEKIKECIHAQKEGNDFIESAIGIYIT